MQQNKKDKGVFTLVMTVSVLVFLLVILLNERLITPPEVFPSFVYKLPLLNASINATVSILLIISYLSIRKKRVERHKRINLTAFGLSALFLISYVCYHFFVGHTSFGGEGVIRIVYKTLLFAHIVLAALVLPLVLLSFWYGLQNKTRQHRRLVRWSFPIWLFVAMSGVVVYLMISPYYPY